MTFRFLPILVLICSACTQAPTQDAIEYPVTGHIERLDPALDQIIDTNARIEIIASGYTWSEGPLWIESEQMLLFSDVPANTVYRWTEEDGASVYLQPSGYTGEAPFTGREPGSNGLLLDADGNLVLCQHGDRQLARMNAPLHAPQPTFVSLADSYQGKRFNSPNDAVFSQTGDLFFTDPPYGLPMQNDEDPTKELPYNGVYQVMPSGEIQALTTRITRPNGIALFPGERHLLVANSDVNAANWYVIDVENPAEAPSLFYSATDARDGVKGLPDGLKISQSGTVFASGPGGIWIFDREANVLGKIRLEEAASNVALSPDEQTLYITNHHDILRVQLR